MSYILDALNKSERERTENKTPGLNTFHQRADRLETKTPQRWLIILTFILSLNLVVLAIWYFTSPISLELQTNVAPRSKPSVSDVIQDPIFSNQAFDRPKNSVERKRPIYEEQKASTDPLSPTGQMRLSEGPPGVVPVPTMEFGTSQELDRTAPAAPTMRRSSSTGVWKIAGSLHMTIQTAVLIETLKALGAEGQRLEEAWAAYIQVHVRVRPLNDQERQRGDHECIHVASDGQTVRFVAAQKVGYPGAPPMPARRSRGCVHPRRRRRVDAAAADSVAAVARSGLTRRRG